MKLDAWRFSAQLAWRDRFIRWSMIGVLLVVVAMSTFLLWRVLPAGMRSGVLTLHYTIYLGIDDVRAWEWLLLYPLGMLAIVVVNSLCTLGWFRKDALAARMLMGVTMALALVWCVNAYFLMIVNL